MIEIQICSNKHETGLVYIIEIKSIFHQQRAITHDSKYTIFKLEKDISVSNIVTKFHKVVIKFTGFIDTIQIDEFK